MNIKYLSHLALTYLLKKKQRTLLSLVSIFLGTALIYTSLILFQNIIQFSNTTSGDYHYVISQTEEIELSTRYRVTKDYTTSIGGSFNDIKYQIHTLEMDEMDPILPFEVLEGTFPISGQEVLISDVFNMRIGEEIDGMIVVGIYKDLNNFEVIPIYSKQEPTNNITYYIKDSQIHLSTSFQMIVEKMKVSGNMVISNESAITTDTFKAYLKDPTLLLIILGLMIVLSMGMSYISVKNVLLITDPSRKKEIGLLKSVGATKKDVIYLLVVELSLLGIIGSLLGIVTGIGLSHYVLSLISKELYVNLEMKMIISPLFIFIAFMTGYGLMVFPGMKAYSPYFISMPIYDLKDMSQDYPITIKTKKTRGASWELFMLYNGRMKKQTKNIKYSFVLLLATTVLFTCVYLSNLVFKNHYKGEDFDFIIRNITTDTNGYIDLDIDFMNTLYDYKENGDILIDVLQVERLSGIGYITAEKSYHPDNLQFYKQYHERNMIIEEDLSETLWTNFYFYPTVLDDHMIEQLKQFEVIGSLDNLGPYDHVLIEYSHPNIVRGTMCHWFNIDDPLAQYSLFSSPNISGQDLSTTPHRVAAIIFLEGDDQYHVDLPLYDHVRFMAQSYYLYEDQKFLGNEAVKVQLRNDYLTNEFQEVVDKLLVESHATEMYAYENIYVAQETTKFASFMIEILLYPLFFMLFMVSLLNLSNVFYGNIHLKQQDFSILKSVGMTQMQAVKILVFEYLEGYFNAGFVVTIFFSLLIGIDQYFDYASVLDISSHIVGTLMMSFAILGPLMIIPLACLTFRQMKKIQPRVVDQ